jgi:hypothetical protein
MVLILENKLIELNIITCVSDSVSSWHVRFLADAHPTHIPSEVLVLQGSNVNNACAL